MNQQKIKVSHADLRAMGIVRNRFDQAQKIKAGKLPPPNKDSDRMQASAWWWWADIAECLERERAETKARIHGEAA